MIAKGKAISHGGNALEYALREGYKRKNLDELSEVEKQFIASIEQANDKLKIAGTTRSEKKNSPSK